MSKVGIITYHFSDNYGALFQAYGLKKWFENNGFDANFINYQPDYVEGGGNLNFSNPISKNNAKILFLKIMTYKESIFGNAEQKKGFYQFRSNALGVSGKACRTKKELEKLSFEFDIYVCGSDQIWKPSEHYGVDPVYFLDFKQAEFGRRISYAPSFGKNTLDRKYVTETSRLIKKLDGVSVREETGCSIVEDLTGIRPVCVPDPTFLLEDYADIMKPYQHKAKKHVFCYALRSREGIGEIAEGIATELGASLLSPHNPHRRWREIGETVYPCPSQWLSLLNTAEYVVTNSFHGTALSILLNKPFVVVGLQGEKKQFNARALNLLNQVGLKNRFIENVDSVSVTEVLESNIDWTMVNKNVRAMRKVAEIYLQSQISEV